METIAEALLAGHRHQLAGRAAEAEQLYREILRADLNNAHALHGLGILATERGDLHAAVELLTRAVRCDRSQAAFYVNLGEAYRRLGNIERAISCNEEALELQPDFVAPHANLGMLHSQRGDLGKAIDFFRRLVCLAPGDPRSSALLGQALSDHGRAAEAEPYLRRAAALAPQDSRTQQMLAGVLRGLGKLHEAAAAYGAALALAPDDALAHNSLGVVLHELDALVDCESHFRRAIEIDPKLAAAYSNLSTALVGTGRHDEAIDCCQQAIQLDPSLATAYSNQALALRALGRLGEAIARQRRAVELKPDDARLHSNLLYLLNYDPAYDAAAIFAEHRAWGRRHADPLTAQSPPHLNDRSPDRRLRVGYLSSHFLAHAVNFFVEPILASHDHEQFEVFCYSNVRQEEAITGRLRSHADCWRNIVGLTDQETNDLARRDRVDILVDLAGHIEGNRLLVFARRPAPVQVTYVGYQNTTGMLAMDYRLTDDYADPPGGSDEFYTEKLVRLPRSFFCYLPSASAPVVTAPPALLKGSVTFGSFNSFAKVTPRVLSAWAQILSRVPGSRLILLAEMTDSLKGYLLTTFESHGVRGERLELAHRRPRQAYLELMQRADIALDPFPFNGHTTTCDALWQGVPVVTLSGNTYVSRFGGSGLATLGLHELIAQNVEQYVEIAVALAEDVDRLRGLRAALRPRMAASPLLDFTGFTRNLEAAYRRIWIDWCTR